MNLFRNIVLYISFSNIKPEIYTLHLNIKFKVKYDSVIESNYMRISIRFVALIGYMFQLGQYKTLFNRLNMYMYTVYHTLYVVIIFIILPNPHITMLNGCDWSLLASKLLKGRSSFPLSPVFNDSFQSIFYIFIINMKERFSK